MSSAEMKHDTNRDVYLLSKNTHKKGNKNTSHARRSQLKHVQDSAAEAHVIAYGYLILCRLKQTE